MPALWHLHHQSEPSSTALASWQGAGSALLLSCHWGLLILTHTARANSTALPSQGAEPTLLSATDGEGLGQPSCSPTSRLAHLHLSHQGQLYLTAQVQGLLSSVLQQVRGKASSPTLMTLGPALLAASGRGGASHLCHLTAGEWWGQLFCGRALQLPGHQLSVTPNEGAGPTLLNAVLGERWGQLSRVPQPMRGRASSAQP